MLISSNIMFLMIAIFALVGGYIISKIYKKIVGDSVKNRFLRLLLLLLIAVPVYMTFFLYYHSYHARGPALYALHFTVFCMFFMSVCFAVMDLLKLLGFKMDAKRAAMIVVLMVTSMVGYGYWNRTLVKLTHYLIKNSKGVKLKIAFLSDVHIGNRGMNEKILQKMVKVINENKVDLVLFGGDVVEPSSISTAEGKKQLEILKKIKAKMGVYGALGNHEFYDNKPGKMAKLIGQYAHINMLRDEHRRIGTNLVLVGRNDVSSKNSRSLKDILRADGSKNKSKNGTKKTNEIKSSDFIILLDHNPKRFSESVDSKVDLQLSGHTHNGQYFPFNLMVKLAYENSYGRSSREFSDLIVTSGLGTAVVPVKIFSPAEVAIIRLE